MNNYQRAREMAGFTQKELAAKIGVKSGIISRYEAESDLAVIPPFPRIKAIANACGVPISFLTDQQDLHPLNAEQSKRLKQELLKLNDALYLVPDETTTTYGTTHPFLYMLKERWEFTVEDLEYIRRRYGIMSNNILHDELPEPDAVRAVWKDGRLDDFQDAKISHSPDDILSYVANSGMSFRHFASEDAANLSLCGIVVVMVEGKSDLYLNLDDLDMDTINALVTLSRKNKKPPQDPEDPETV